MASCFCFTEAIALARAVCSLHIELYRYQYGQEHECGPTQRSDRMKKKVFVIGGGPTLGEGTGPRRQQIGIHERPLPSTPTPHATHLDPHHEASRFPAAACRRASGNSAGLALRQGGRGRGPAPRPLPALGLRLKVAGAPCRGGPGGSAAPGRAPGALPRRRPR